MANKAIDLRDNEARSNVPGDLNAKFAQGQAMATERQKPTDPAVNGATGPAALGKSAKTGTGVSR